MPDIQPVPPPFLLPMLEGVGVVGMIITILAAVYIVVAAVIDRYAGVLIAGGFVVVGLLLAVLMGGLGGAWWPFWVGLGVIALAFAIAAALQLTRR